MKSIFSILILSIWAISTFAQDKLKNFSGEIQFAEHLTSLNEYKDAIFVLKNMKNINGINQDSIHYLIAWNYFLLNNLDSAIVNFDKVQPIAKTHNKSIFFNSYCNTLQKNYMQGNMLLTSFNPANKDETDLKNLHLCSISLLNNDFNIFDSLYSMTSNKNQLIINHRNNTLEYYNTIKNFKKKSGFVAGLFSSLIPGSGKVYAGRYGEGAAAFLMTTSLGLITYENYRKAGLYNYKTLIFGSILSVYYIGNIWGSVISIKIRRDEFNDEMEHKILLDMHIPLHIFFE